MNPARFRRVLAITAIVLAIAVLVFWLFDRRRPADTTPSLSAAKTVPLPAGSARRGEFFASLRNSTGSTALREPDWTGLATDLTHLETLEGAFVDPETGQLLLVGRRTDGRGPFQLEDISVVLGAAYRELEPVGMTIDEDPQNKRGPRMFVRFFAGTRDTHLGQVMFECDRLMKSLGLGEDNISNAPLASAVQGFKSQLELVERLEAGGQGPSWDRYWINLSQDSTTGGDALRPVVDVAANASAIWLLQHRLYVATEQMLDAGEGPLRSSGGRQSPSARAFARFLNDHYDEIAGEFPAFADLQQLARLVVLSDWIRRERIPVDPELLFQWSDSGVRTPETTPTLLKTRTWTRGSTTREVQLFGGVALDPRTRFVQSPDRRADALAQALRGRQDQLRAGTAVTVNGQDGVPLYVVPVGPPIRGPTDAGGHARRPLRITEATGRVAPSEQTTAAYQERANAAFAGFELGVWGSRSDADEMLDLPVLREVKDAHRKSTVTFSSPAGGPSYEVDVPAALQLSSPSRSIAMRFSLEPKFDVAAGEPYFPAAAADDVRYYPRTRSITDETGTTYRFDTNGIVEGIRTADGERVRFEHHAYRDGRLATADAESRGPRGPPLRVIEATGGVAPSLLTPPPLPVRRLTIWNENNGRAADVFHGSEGVQVSLR